MKYVILILVLIGSHSSWGQSLNDAIIGAYRFEIPNKPDSNGMFVPVHPIESISIDSNLRVSKTESNPYNYSHCTKFKGELEIRLDTLTISYTSKLHLCDIDNIHAEGVYPKMIEKYLIILDSNAVQSLVALNEDKKEFKRIEQTEKEDF